MPSLKHNSLKCRYSLPNCHVTINLTFLYKLRTIDNKYAVTWLINFCFYLTVLYVSSLKIQCLLKLRILYFNQEVKPIQVIWLKTPFRVHLNNNLRRPSLICAKKYYSLKFVTYILYIHELRFLISNC